MSVSYELAKSIAYRRKRLYGWLLRNSNQGRHSPDIRNLVCMTEDNLAAADIYQGGQFWSEINREFADFLWAGAITSLRNEYFNRRFAGPDPSSRQVWRALLWLYYQRLQQLDIDGFLKSASEPPEGGTADQELVDGRPMSLDFLQSVEEVYRLREAWVLAGLPNQPRVIIELGAGYGRLAYVCRKMLPDCCCIILDLPEALTCSSSWLNRVLPGEVVPYNDSRAMTDFTRDTLLSRRVWVLGAHQIENIASGAVDAFVNIYSFAEMPRRSIENYFAQLDRITSGIFYSKQRKRERNVVDGIEVTAESYPVRPNWRMLFHRTSTLYEAFFESSYYVSSNQTQPA